MPDSILPLDLRYGGRNQKCSRTVCPQCTALTAIDGCHHGDRVTDLMTACSLCFSWGDRMAARLEIVRLDAMDRFHKLGLIPARAGRTSSVALTDEGLRRAERLFRDLYTASPSNGVRQLEPDLQIVTDMNAARNGNKPQNNASGKRRFVRSRAAHACHAAATVFCKPASFGIA